MWKWLIHCLAYSKCSINVSHDGDDIDGGGKEDNPCAIIANLSWKSIGSIVQIEGGGKSRFTVVRMENNTLLNSDTIIKSVLCSYNCKLTFAPPCIDPGTDDW